MISGWTLDPSAGNLPTVGSEFLPICWDIGARESQGRFRATNRQHGFVNATASPLTVQQLETEGPACKRKRGADLFVKPGSSVLHLRLVQPRAPEHYHV
jgi:hypothetical protein